MKNKIRKPKPSMPYWYWIGQDGCWFCKDRNNCNACPSNKKSCKTKLERNPKTEQLFQVIARAEKWLKTHQVQTPIIKWETTKWGEVPADFGRKNK